MDEDDSGLFKPVKVTKMGKSGLFDNISTPRRSERGSVLFTEREISREDLNSLEGRLEVVRGLAKRLAEHVDVSASRDVLYGVSIPLIGDQRLDLENSKLLERLGYSHKLQHNPNYVDSMTGIYTRVRGRVVEILLEDISPPLKPGPFYLFFIRAPDEDAEDVIDVIQKQAPGIAPTLALWPDAMSDIEAAKYDRQEVTKRFSRRKKTEQDGLPERTLVSDLDTVEKRQQMLPHCRLRNEACVKLWRMADVKRWEYYEGPYAILGAFTLLEDPDSK